MERYQNECFLALYNYWNPGYAVKPDRRQVEQHSPKDQQLMEAYQDTISILKNENQSLHKQLRFMMGGGPGLQRNSQEADPTPPAWVVSEPYSGGVWEQDVRVCPVCV
ncbi:hypothetical protein DSLASN_01600 [Desulfoluna limicola]|uniref:Transposase n=1 Tax=Desulfoluna limicola TaxID=2810562 RepID=A0ABM7PBP4_9BACT|nr:hypothetical protein DSLASN_01600 [Desulfoluna limicola]